MNQRVLSLVLDLVRRFEGLRLRAYYCPAGVLTCGYGSTGPDIRKDTVWTIEQAEARAAKDALVFIAAANRLCPGQSDGTLAALSDFAYNLGATRLAGSTLRRKVNAGDLDGAKLELARWIRGGGRVLPGLIKRRAAEARIFGQ